MRLADFAEIFYNDTLVISSSPAIQKSNLKNPRWRTAAILKNVKCNISATVINFGVIWFSDAYC